MTKETDCKIAYIKWIDSYYDSEGYKIESIKKQENCFHMEEVGWLIEENKDCIRFATSYCCNTAVYRYVHVIPRTNIIKIKKWKK